MSDYSISDDGSDRAQKAVDHATGKSAIHIKPSREGSLHSALGIPQDQKIPSAELAGKPGDSPAVSKKKNFARNAAGWSK